MILTILSLWNNIYSKGFHLLHIDNKYMDSSLLYMEWTKNTMESEKKFYFDIFYWKYLASIKKDWLDNVREQN